MSTKRHSFHITGFEAGTLICLLLGVCSLLVWDTIRRTAGDITAVSSRVSSALAGRIDLLDDYVQTILGHEARTWRDIPQLPEDMAIYKYSQDSLQSWYNCFPVMDDNLDAGMSYPVLSSSEYLPVPVLRNISEKPSLVNMGSRWYVAKCIISGNEKIIAGIELFEDDGDGYSQSTNANLPIPQQYSVCSINGNDGVPVYIDGNPVFLLQTKTGDEILQMRFVILKWLALLLFTTAAVLFLAGKKTLKALAITLGCLVVIFVWSRMFGDRMIGFSRIFSPSLYASGPLWSSFGALMLMNSFLFLGVLCIYMVREKLIALCLRSRKGLGLFVAFSALLTLGATAYTLISLYSLVMNSGISLEPKWFRDGLFFTLISIFIYTELFAGILLMAKMTGEAHLKAKGAGRIPGKFSYSGISAFAILFSLMFFVLSVRTDMVKEQNRTTIWANRLALDRDLGLELRLRAVEEQIASDNFIAMLCGVDNAEDIIAGRISEMYLYQTVNNYDVHVSICRDNDPECLNLFRSKIIGGAPIATASRMYCKYDSFGKANYAGMFLYSSRNRKLARMLITLEPKTGREYNGYDEIFRTKNSSVEIAIPEFYSYAIYINRRLASYKGTYAYPTLLTEPYANYAEQPKNHYRGNGYVHYFHKVDTNEYVVISRSARGILTIISSLLSILAITVTSLLPLVGRTMKEDRRRNTFRKRINLTLTLAIFASLVVLASISVKFVFDNNLRDTRNLMSSRISTIQSMIQDKTRDAANFSQINNPEFRNQFLNIAENNRSDLSLYSPDGRVFMTTAPEVFQTLRMPLRISDEAYYGIKYRHQRFHIIKDSYNGKTFYSLYAPVFNSREDMVAIVCSPFTGNLNMMREAIPHAVLMLLLVLTLMVAFSTVAASVIDRMLAPLSEVSRKMETAGTHGLEYIIYRSDDELSNLIDSYNRMVHGMSESSRILAQSEREKAWSAMARQVAHEIKNPLTPIKLEIQRLIRLKQKNAPDWNEKFDKVSGIILEHIDMLTDTANEFSTFAKLYTEQPVFVNLDRIIQDQITIFDNKDNIEITYMGLNNAGTMAPKPQLIRVFVNLLTNSIQAIEIQQQEALSSGKEPMEGKIAVSLRNSSEDGYYDIVFEDNGPGVSDENLGKLFTPSFTTKSAGTGLGLAMCHSIIEKCEGTIRYEKSFALDGACFIVKLPKKS